MNNVQDRALGAMGAPLLQDPSATCADLTAARASSSAMSLDRIGRLPLPVLRQAPANGTPDGLSSIMGGGIMEILSQLLSLLTQVVSMAGLTANANATYFQSATASSEGDPHLAFRGTDSTGNTQQTHFDSMTAHSDLLDSDSFDGGYRISTTATPPGAGGITYNQQAAIETDYGQTRVALDANGNVLVCQGGKQLDLQAGGSYDLGNGESVARAADGSLTVTDSNGMGASITTIMRRNGPGVDVDVNAQHIDVGGDILGAQRWSGPIPSKPQPWQSF